MDPTTARNLFPVVRRYTFLNHASIASISDRSRAALDHVIDELTHRPFREPWATEKVDHVRSAIGQLINAPTQNIAFTRSTAHGLSLLANGFDWTRGDNVVGAKGEYPSNVYPWMALAQKGVEYRMADLENGRVTPESIFKLVDDRTRIVALSHVEFWNGYRVDLETIGNECRARGIIFSVDGIQSAGMLQIDLTRLPVDFFACAAHKWLLGPNGIGFCYCTDTLLDRLHPVLVGVGSVKRNKEYFDYDLDFSETASKFEESWVSLLTVVPFGAAIDLLLEVGPKIIEKRALNLAARLANGLVDIGFEIVPPWPRKENERSAIVSCTKPGSSIEEPLRDLTASGVICRVHKDFIRLSPHFYNTEEEIDRVISVLAPQLTK